MRKKPDVVLERFDPIHLVDWQKQGALAGSNRESLDLPRRIRYGIEHCQHLFRGILVRHGLQPADGAIERECKALFRHWFQEIVDRGDFKGPDGVLVVRGHEDERRHALCSDGVDDRKAISSWHLHVQEHKVRFFLANEGDCLPPVSRFGDRFHLRLTA
jgi:hypothetical protein